MIHFYNLDGVDQFGKKELLAYCVKMFHMNIIENLGRTIGRYDPFGLLMQTSTNYRVHGLLCPVQAECKGLTI